MDFEKLDDDQIEVVRWKPEDGDLRVVSAAGSGKTTTVTALTTKLVLVDDIAPEDICVLTFANKAGKTLRERINASLGVAQGAKVNIGTFHGLALRECRSVVPEAFPMEKCMNISPRDGRASHIPSVQSMWRSAVVFGTMPGTGDKSLRCSEDIHPYLREVTLERAAGRDVTTAKPRKTPKRFLEAWALVEKAKSSLGAWEFDEALFAWLKLLNDRRVRRFKVVIVDEAQDNNKIQGDIARALVADGGALVQVGDLRQTIHVWRGAYPKYFKSDSSNTVTTELRYNYRSGDDIVKLCNAFSAGKEWSLGSPASPTRGKSGEVAVVEYPDHYTQALRTAQDIAEEVKAGVSKSRAVLCRTNGMVAMFEAAFIEAGVPAKIQGGYSILSSWDAKVVVDYMKALCHRDTGALASVLNTPKRYVPRSFTQMVQTEPMMATEQVWTFLRRLARRAPLSRGSKTNILDLAYWLESTSQAAYNKMPQLVYQLMAEGLPEDTRSPQESDSLMVMHAAAVAISRYPTLEAFLTRMETLQNSTPDQYVLLSTIHKAKGLEWDEVHVDVTEGMVPHFRTSARMLGEEERLLYVAMSRARDRLLLSYAMNGDHEHEEGGMSSLLDKEGLSLPSAVTP